MSTARRTAAAAVREQRSLCRGNVAATQKDGRTDGPNPIMFGRMCSSPPSNLRGRRQLILFFGFSSHRVRSFTMGRPPYMDSLKAPLHPCSLETIQEPVKLADGSSVWPMMLACYQLQENGTTRQGHLSLYTVPVPDIQGSNESSMPLQFGDPHVVLDSEQSSGILDGKWLADAASAGTETTNTAGDAVKSWPYATAHSTGEIRMHALQVPQKTDDLPRLESDPLYMVAKLGESTLPDRGDSDSAVAPLCLALNWDTTQAATTAATENTTCTDPTMRQIVSTYSNGRVAIHDVAFSSSGQEVQIMERDSWQAHNIFTCPAEVWSATFAHDGNKNLILSCGDEGSLKFWDVRTTSRPMQVLKDCFEAGVTCASHHPRREHLVACGSYDETVALFDVRYLSQTPICHSEPLGGGIWRIKWHPVADDRLLVGAMHGGCRVLRIQGWDAAVAEEDDSVTEDSQVGFKVTKKFTEHESMAYGADWLVCRHPTQNGYFEAAASCSFYDRAVYMWDTVF